MILFKMTSMFQDCLEDISVEDFLQFSKKGSNSLDRWADWFNRLSHLTASQVCLVRLKNEFDQNI